MTPDLFLRTSIEPALSLLPPLMETDEARAMLIAIALQESKLAHRQQVGGPARGYLQFELAGLEGVLTHEKTWAQARAVALALDVTPTAPGVYLAIEYHDVLACVFGRLLLWTLPRPLPARTDEVEGWQQYLALWRPGKPRRETWASNYLDAWQTVTA